MKINNMVEVSIDLPFPTFAFLAPKELKVIYLLNSAALRVPDEGYYRNVS
jgi:hypothetical protein